MFGDVTTRGGRRDDEDLYRPTQVSSGPPLVRNSLALPFLPRAE